MKRIVFATVVLIACLLAAGPLLAQDQQQNQQQGMSEQQMLIQNLHATYSGNIDSKSVGNLDLKYNIKTNSYCSSMPVVDNGTLYFTDWAGYVYAADAQTGNIKWSKQIEQNVKTDWAWHGFAGSPVMADGLLIAASVEGNAYGIDPNNGDVKWHTKYTDQQYAGNLSDLTAYDGVVYIGVQSTQEPISGAMHSQGKSFTFDFQGGVVALSTQSGEHMWTMHTVEKPGNGCAVWSSFAIDPDMNALFFTSGNNYPGGPATSGSDSMWAVDLKSGKEMWHTQMTPYDIWGPVEHEGPDYDFGAGPNLFEATLAGQILGAAAATSEEGQKVMLVGAGAKSGQYTAFNRKNGDIVWYSTIGYGGVGGGIRGEAAVAQDGTLVLWSNNSWNDLGDFAPKTRMNSVKAINADSGNYKWVNYEAQPAMGTSAGFLSKDVFFVGSLDGTLNAYNMKDGKKAWGTTVPNGSGVAGSLLVKDDMLFVPAGVVKRFSHSEEGQSGMYVYALKQQ